MISSLIIKDFAIIDQLDVDFHDGLSVLTGETGAGKSIIIDALNLLLGGRASVDTIRTGANEAIVEAAFCFQGARAELMRARLEKLNLDSGSTQLAHEELVIRRSISRAERSRVSVNGCLVNVAGLKQLMAGVVDISGQHEHVSLLNPMRHLPLLDRFAAAQELAQEMAQSFRQLEKLRQELDALRSRARDRLARLDFLEFQINELEAASLDPLELPRLEQELRELENASLIRDAARNGVDQLYEDDRSVCVLLARVNTELERAARQLPALRPIADELAQARLMIEDNARQLQRFCDLEDDPLAIDRIHERVALLARLQRKYGRNIDELIEELAKMRTELEQLKRGEELSLELEGRIRQLGGRALTVAAQLSRKRRDAVASLQQRIEEHLSQLGFSSARFIVELDTQEGLDALSSKGLDQVEFLFAPNLGEQPKALAKIASGGELSRVMLAFKQVFAELDDVACYIFDELDAGIGGQIAAHVAQSLLRVAEHHQVLCITHLATIASCAQHHYVVKKKELGERTLSELSLLPEQDRVGEIARMLGGLGITELSLEHASEMMRRARNSALPPDHRAFSSGVSRRD
ncbi:MAG: DNA repair protein RecN [Myxococcota bacterium]|jgi:DNA repair protein RecN (Recombination protein N)|nr:DNA repair protein RecN [Myxococcota bacterium]